MSEGLSHYRIRRSLDVIEKVMLVHRVQSTAAHGLPLGANSNHKVFKLIFLDIGLLQHISGVSPNTVLAEKDLLVPKSIM